MSKNGRPRLLDDVKQGQICALVKTGFSIDRAAEFVGCSAVTIRREANRNRNFKERLQHAEGACVYGPLEALRKLAQTNWRAAAWLLERIDPERFIKPKIERLEIKHLNAIVRGLLDAVVDEVHDKTECQRVFNRVGDLAHMVAYDLHSPLHTSHRVQTVPWYEYRLPGTELSVDDWGKDLANERDFEEIIKSHAAYTTIDDAPSPDSL